MSYRPTLLSLWTACRCRRAQGLSQSAVSAHEHTEGILNQTWPSALALMHALHICQACAGRLVCKAQTETPGCCSLASCKACPGSLLYNLYKQAACDRHITVFLVPTCLLLHQIDSPSLALLVPCLSASDRAADLMHIMK